MNLKILRNTNKQGTKFLSYVLLILTIIGTISFTLFIEEEAFQTLMFGTWPAQDVGQWKTVARGCNLMETNCKVMKWTLYSIGWLNPLAFVSYRQYTKAADYYVQALRCKVAVHAPEELVGKTVSLSVVAGKIEVLDRGYRVHAGQLCILVNQIPTQKRLHIRGRIEMVDGYPTIDIRRKFSNERS